MSETGFVDVAAVVLGEPEPLRTRCVQVDAAAGADVQQAAWQPLNDLFEVHAPRRKR